MRSDDLSGRRPRLLDEEASPRRVGRCKQPFRRKGLTCSAVEPGKAGNGATLRWTPRRLRENGAEEGGLDTAAGRASIPEGGRR